MSDSQTTATTAEPAAQTPFEESEAAASVLVHTTETKARRCPVANPGLLALKCGAEFLGVLFVTFAILIVYTLSQLLYQYSGITPIILATALAYGAVSALFGRLSGAQLNPAVTVAAMLTSRTHWIDGILYIVAQVLGGLAGAALYMLVLPTSESVPASTWFTMVVNGFDDASRSSGALTNAGISFGSTFAVVVEVVACMIVVGASVSTLRDDGSADPSHAWVAALAYGAGAAFAYPVTGAALNPARATGVALLAHSKGLTVDPLSQLWVFWIAPLFAAALAAIAMIVAQMVEASAGKAKAADELDDPDALVSEASEESEESEEDAHGEVQNAQAEAQGDGDEGVERH
ncbi:MIP/aquaporin family protein [Bifidobacterium avesanii]|uniref:Glycerol transporter n=1 Tax=Bifidobacterium avesanii TaxID=1798157 RepID=A0A7K3TEJ1_9BIFI|nr:aquaporin [Bifidobacterium avesanii]KAB8295446.1 glycerol transporter [Bifidobacterium avesanii]NEG77452.1 glycerol transporter [Bifidobacterium avesanii]